MADRTLTAANSVILIGVNSLFSVPQQLQGFSTDDVFGTEAVEPTETMMGVDGILSGGWVATAKKMTITLQADSASCDFFDTWFQTQETSRETLTAFGIARLPALNKSFALVRGFLSNYTPTAEVKKIMQPRKFTITWQSITAAPI